MGNTNSSGITLDKFKDQVFGAAILLLAPRLDNKLKFVVDTEATTELSELRSGLNILPNVLQEHASNILVGCTTYYNSESREDRQDLIDRYVNQVVLGSNERADAFLSLLVRQLNARHKETQDRINAPNPVRRSADSTFNVNVSMPKATQNNNQSSQNAVTSKTTMKLDRKIQQLNNEIAQQKHFYQERNSNIDNDAETVEGEYQQSSDTEEGHLVQVTVAPTQETVAPTQETIAPTQETIAPTQETIVPTQETVVPTQETVVPTQETVAPTQEAVVPTQEL